MNAPCEQFFDPNSKFWLGSSQFCNKLLSITLKLELLFNYVLSVLHYVFFNQDYMFSFLERCIITSHCCIIFERKISEIFNAFNFFG